MGRVLVVALSLLGWGCGSRSAVSLGEDGDAGPHADGDAGPHADGDAGPHADGDADADGDGDVLRCPGDTRWRIETVSTYATDPHIAVAEDGGAHILYQRYRRRRGGLRGPGYATNASGQWTTEELDRGVHMAGAAIAFDEGGAPVATFGIGSNASGGRAVFARRGAGGWEQEELGTADETVEFASLAVDPEGAVHLFHVLPRAERASVVLGLEGTISEVTDSPQPVRCASFAIDRSGRNHAVVSADPGFTYLTDASGAWVSEATDRGFSTSYCAIAFDPEDRPHAFLMVDWEIVDVVLGDDTWQGQPTGIELWNGLSNIATAPDGSLHLIEILEEQGGLMHVTNAGGSWEEEDLVDAPGVFQSPFIAIADDRIHVAFGKRPPDGPPEWRMEADLLYAVRCLE